MTQFALDFSGRLPVSAQIGMQTADDNANEKWKRWVDGCIQMVARQKQEFTADDIYAALEALPNPPDTHNLGALGPRMQRVAHELGYMKSTGRVQRSKRPEKHGNLHTVWESLIWSGK